MSTMRSFVVVTAALLRLVEDASVRELSTQYNNEGRRELSAKAHKACCNVVGGRRVLVRARLTALG